MSETSGAYTGATTASTASDRERELCEEQRWEEAGRLVAEIIARVSDWLQLPPDAGATTASAASARERELRASRRWEEARHLVAAVARRVSDCFRLPPDVEQHFRQACLEQLRGVSAMIDHQIAEVGRTGRRRTGTRINVE